MTMKRPNAFTPLTLRAAPPISPPAAAPALPADPLIQPPPRHRTWRTMLLGSATFAVAGLLQGTAFAQCDTTPTTGNDSISCGIGPFANQTIDALAGNDTIQLDGSVIAPFGATTVDGGADNDSITLLNGASVGALGVVQGGAGDDTIALDSGVTWDPGALFDGQTGTDTLQFTTGGASTIDPSNFAGFENLFKDGSDTLTLTGDHTFANTVDIDDGTLNVVGSLTTSRTDIASFATLQLPGGAFTSQVFSDGTITGSATADALTFTAGSQFAFANGSSSLIQSDGGDDTITFDDVIISLFGSATVSGGAGADEITLTNSTVTAQIGSQARILGDAGNDTILIDDTYVADLGSATVDGGVDDDLITLTNGASVGALGVVQGGAGSDTIALDNSVTWNAAASFSGGEGTDTLQFTAAGADTIDASNFAGFEALFKDGSDTLTLAGDHTFANTVDIDAGTLSVTGSLTTLRTEIASGATLQLPGGAFTSQVVSDGTITGSATADALTFTAGSQFATASGLSSLIQGDGGADTITFDEAIIGLTGSATVTGGAGADSISLTSYSRAGSTSTGSAQIFGDAGNDTILIDNSTVALSGAATVDGGADNDSITLSNNATLGASAVIQGGAGDDTIGLDNTVTRNALASIDGGGGVDTLQFTAAGADTIDASNFTGFENLFKDGSNTLSLTGDHTFANTVDIDEGTLNVVGSLTTFRTDIASGATLQLPGGAFASIVFSDGTITGGATNDALTFAGGSQFAIANGSSSLIQGDAGDDTITFDESIIGITGSATVTGGAGADSIYLTSFSRAGSTSIGSAQIFGDAGNDTITIDESYIGYSGSATVSGGADNDSISVVQGSRIGYFTGSSGTVLGDAGNDTILIDNSTVALSGAATVDGGADNDSITLSNNATLGASAVIQGGAGDDTIGLDNTVTRNAGASIDGGGGIDTLQFTAAGADTIDLSDFTGFESLFKDGSDTLTLTGNHTLTGNVRVAAGTLNVAGSLDADGTQIDSGATLQLPGGAFGTFATINGTLRGASTADSLQFFGGSTIGGASGSNAQVLGDAGNDTIQIEVSTIGVSGNATVDGGADIDWIYLQNNTRIGGNAQILGGAGADTFFLVGPLQIDAGALIDGGLGPSNTLDISGSADLTLDGSNFANFDFLDQNGTGTTTLSGSFSIPTETDITAGTLDIAGSLTTPQTTIASGATLSVSGGTFASEVDSDGTITGSATGDALTFNAGSLFATFSGSTSLIEGDAGNDTITLNSSRIGDSGTATVSGGAGADEINLTTGTIFGLNSSSQILGDAGNDTILLEGSLIGNPGAPTVDGGADNDLITLTNGTVVGATASVLGGAGNDTISVDGTVTWASSTAFLGDAGTDQFSVEASSPLTLDESNLNFERLVKTGTDRLTLTGTHTFSDLVQIGAGTLTIDSFGNLSTARTEIATGATLELSDRAFASQVISDGTITGSATGDDVTFNAGSRFATTDGATSLIQGDSGDDTFTFDDSKIGYRGAATVSGGAGADTINLTNGTFLSYWSSPFSNPSGVILGDAGDDHIIISDSTIGYSGMDATIDAGEDNDSILLQNSTINTGDILGGAGDDTVSVTDSFFGMTATLFDGGDGTDEFAFSSASIASLNTASLTGFETLLKNGTGTLTLFGDHTISTSTQVNAGTLDLMGTLTTAATTIAPDATLRVSGGAFSSMVTVGGTLTGSAADNDITLSTSSSVGQTAGQIGSVLGDAGADTITLQSTAVGIYGEGRVYGGTGADSISLGNSSDLAFHSTGVGRIGGDAGADTIDIDDSIVGRTGSATVSGGADGDSIALGNKAHLAFSTDATAQIDGDAGADTITIVDSYVGRLGDATVSGGDGADSISLSVSSNLGYYAGGSGQVLGDAGDDTVTLDQTWVGYLGDGTISGGEDNDLLTITGNVSNDFAGIAYQSNSNGRLNGDAGQDTILLNEAPVGFRGSATVDGGADADSISLTSNSDIARFTGSTGLVRGDSGADTIRVDNSYVGWEGGATVSGGDGADSISLATDSNIAVSGGSSSAVYGDGGADTISLDDSFVGRAGNATVSGGEDADSISLTNASNIAHDSGSTGIVQGDAGADTISLDDSYLGRDGNATVSGGADADSISLTSNSDIAVNTGSTALVRGDAGADTIRIENSYVGWGGSATVSGGDGNDSISLANSSNIGVDAGISGVVLGDDGADTITIDDSRIGIDGSATVDGGADHDLITLRNGSDLNATSAVLGGTGNDTIVIDSSVSFANGGTIDGGADTDQIALNAETNLTVADGVFTNFEQLAKNGTATLTLSGDQTYATGVEVNAGTLEISNTLSTPLMEIDNGATLLVSGGTFESQILNDGIVSGSSGGDTIVFSAGSQIGANAGSAAQVLGGAGNDTIALSDTTEIGANALIDGGADTDLLTYTTAADASFAGANVSGFEQFIKAGAGTLTLSGDHAYTDSTAINAGTLSVTGALTTAQLDVNAGGTLGGIGTITGAVNVASGGRLSPGTSPGTLSIDGDLTLDSGAVSVFEVGGAGSDLVQVSGNANVDGVLELSDGMGGAAVSGFYTLFDVDGTTTGGFSTLSNNGVVGSVFQGTATDPSGGSALNILVQAGGQNVQFFDGANLVANGLVDGGSGALNAVSSNFTTLDGLFNAPFAGDVAVFMGAPGTVTVDAAQDFEGFQFVTDGYQFTGADLVAVGDSALNTAASFLNADADTNTVIDTVISGTAGIDKFGSGTVQLTRANTFTGATTVVGGQLVLSGDGALASESIGVTSGTLSTDGGAFAASASVTIDAPGTLTVSGDETLAALTNDGRTDIGTSATLSAGTIDNLETGTIVLADGASLIGTQNTLNNAGLISVSAGGTLTDTGDINNLSTGQITFSAASGSADFGALGSNGITNDGQISFLAGNIDLEGDVTNQNSGVIEIASGLVSQTGDFTNSEDARLNLSGGSLTGTSVFNNRGTIDIADGQSLDVGTFNQIDGEVRLDGALLGNLNYTGGDLIGLSSVSGNLVASGGAVLEPGDVSLGTLAIGGNLSLEAGSTLLIQVSDAAADQLAVAGSVTIAGGTLQLEDFASAASDDDLTFIIIDNDGADAVLGSGFDKIVDNLAFLDPVVALNGGDGNDVILSFIMDEQITFRDLVSGTDLGQVAIGLDSAPRDDAEVQALLRAFAPLTIDQVQAGMETLTGEIHAGTQIALASTALYVGDTVTDALDAHRQAKTGRDNDRFVFAQAFGRDVEIDGSSTGNDMAVRNHGLMFGGGLNVSDNLTLGASLGYIGSKNKIYASAGSQSEVRSGALVGFAQYQTAAYDVTASLGYMLSKVNTVRAISVGTLFDRAEDHYDGQSGFAKIEAGYRFEAGRVHVRPFASAAVVSTNRLGISERGAGAANLEATAAVDDLGEVILGARAHTQIALGDMILVPHAELAYDQLIGDLTPEFMTNFQFGGDAFTITATKPGRHRGRFQTGFSAQLSGSLQGFFDYQNTVSKQDQAHAIKLGIKSKF